MVNKFSAKLKELRTDKGLTQNQLAKKLGFTHTAINLWESKKKSSKF